MSKEIDERVVEMKFDNKQFENNVQTSLGTLEKLKRGLDLSNSAKGLEAIGDASKRVSFDGMSSGVETLRMKFSTLQVMAVTALANITNSVINLGKRMVSSLTIDPIREGMADYNRKLTSVQTIMNGTGKSIKEVSKYFDQLDEYADKTIYNLDDMTSAFAKFTNAGVSMDKSIPAIKGIANMVADAGQDAGAAQIAFYNLSQSIAGGFLTTTDFRSLNLANVATKEWKNQMIQGALAAGTLKKNAKGLYVIPGVKEACTEAALFNEQLSKGWATTDVLLKVLGKYADTTTVIGKRAQAAAQDVKSFGMMMDTLKAAVGTGWTDTFEILIGNLEESKALFTPLTNSIGGFLDSLSKSRNNFLQSWKDLGGRTALIEALGNAFKYVGSVLKPIGEAFREVFPPMTAKQLYNICDGLRKLTANLKLTSEQSEKIKSVFKGLFSILDLVKNVFLFLLKTGTGDAVRGILAGLANNILTIAGAIGDVISSLDRVINKTGALNKIANIQTATVKVIVAVVKGALDGITAGISALAAFISGGLNSTGINAFSSGINEMGNNMTKVTSAAGDMKTGVVTAINVMGSAIVNSRFVKLLSAMWKFVSRVSNDIIKLIGKMTDSVTDKLNNADFGKIYTAVAGLSLGGMVVTIVKFIKGLSQPFKSLKDITGGIVGVLDGVRGCFESYQQKLKAGTLLKIAIAIGLLAASLFVIASIDSDKMASSVAAMGVLFGELLTAMGIFNKISKDTKKALKTSIVMISMALAVSILAGAMKKLADLNWNGVAKGLVSIAGLSAIMLGAAKVLSTCGKRLVKGATTMIIFALAVKILASACEDLSKISWEGLAKGLVGVGALFGEMSLFLNTAKFGPKAISTATGILILSAAIKVLASACKDFSLLSWEGIGKGLAGIAALLTELTIFTKVSGDTKGLIAMGAGLILISTSIKILASAVSDLGSMDTWALGQGLLGMANALAIIAVAVKFMPKNLPIVGLGLVAVGVALTLIASAFKIMGSMSYEQVGLGIAALAGSLTILAGALYVMKGTLSGAAALLVAAGAIAILTPSLVALSILPLSSIIKGLVALAGAFAIIGIAGKLLTPAVPAIIGLGVAIALFGVGIAAIGAGMFAFSAGLSALAVSGVAGAAALTVVITSVINLIPLALTTFAQGIIAFAAVIAAGAPVIAGAIVAILSNVITLITQITPQVINCIMTLLTAMLNAIVKAVPMMINAGVSLIIGILNGIAENLPKVIASGVNVILQFIKGVIDSVPKIVDAAFKIIISFINGLANAIRNNHKAIYAACRNLINAIIDALVDMIPELIGVGGDMIRGLIKGVKSMGGALWSTVKGIGSGAVSGLKKLLGIHSPSKVFGEIGMYSMKGFANGITSFGGVVSNQAKNVGTNAIDTLRQAMSNISDVVNGDVDMSPTIRPVVDLDSVTSGIGAIDSMFSRKQAISVATSADRASSVNRDMQTTAKNQNGSDFYDLLDEIREAIKDGLDSSNLDLSGTLEVQVVNDKGEIVGIAQKAVKDLLRRESR